MLHIFNPSLQTGIFPNKLKFGFQEGHSTEHAIVQLVDQIRNSFESKQYTLGVFIDLSKAFHLSKQLIIKF